MRGWVVVEGGGFNRALNNSAMRRRKRARHAGLKLRTNSHQGNSPVERSGENVAEKMSEGGWKVK